MLLKAFIWLSVIFRIPDDFPLQVISSAVHPESITLLKFWYVCRSHSVVFVLCVCETSVSERGQQRYSWLLGEVLASRRMGKEFLAGVVVTFHCARVPLPLGTYNCVLSRRRLSGALSRKRERINKLLAKHKSASQSRVYVFTRLQRSVCTCSLSKRTLFSLSLKDSHAGTYQTSS